jgi:transcriptional regulator with XRE-family HTH domain
LQKSTFTREYTVLRKLLREQREAAGITQVELAARLGETQSYISKVERGERRLDLVQLGFFCRNIGMSLTEFVAQFQKHTNKRSER